jgi:EAL domain-containing protein (putative c-di-GMP-specific phosphodiesterase class I)
LLTSNITEGISLEYSYLPNGDIKQTQDLVFSDFISTPINKIPMKYADLNLWFKVSLKNTLPVSKNLTLILDNPMSDSISIFEKLDSDHVMTLAVLGDRVSNVEQKQRILPHVSFLLDSQESKTILIRLETAGSPFLPLLILSSEEFEEYEKTLHLIWGTFIGIVLLMSAYNLVLYFGVGDRTYFMYIGYIISMLLLLGVVHGYGYYIFPEPIQLWLSDKVIALNSIAAFFTLQFALLFLRFTPRSGRIYDITSYISIGILVYMVFALVVPEHIAAKGFIFPQLVIYLIAFRLIALKARTHFSWTKYYIISWIPFFIGAAIGYLLYSGTLQYSFFNRHALMFSVIFEMAFISMALADRLGDIEKRRLFQATHDFKLGFANEGLLEEAIKNNSDQRQSRGLALITIEISNYDAVIPYLDEDQLKYLIGELADSFEHQFDQSFELIKIDPFHAHHNKTALIRGEMFAFLIRSNNKTKISSVLKEVSNHDNFNPIQTSIPYRIHCVFGAAVLMEYSNHPLELIKEAKRAINQASEANAPYFIYSQNHNHSSERKVRLAQDLGNAIRENTLSLYHQPQLWVQDPYLNSSEVLLRWNHPELGTIEPVEFVQIAEETGLIKRLSRWVINQAFSQTKQLLKACGKNLNVSINISANDLSRAGFVDEVETMLSNHALNAELFTLELTETAHLTDQETFDSNFEKLNLLGFKFAIDDFGTGYSSLEYANNHPFSELKLDRQFITDMLISKKRRTIVTATIKLAKELGLNTTAEGVEDTQTLNALKILGCDKIQGYELAKAMPFEDYLKWHYEPNEKHIGVGQNLTIPFSDVK